MSTGEALRFNVPLDMSDPEDEAIANLFSEIPNGLKQSVLRMALKKIMPTSEDEMRKLLGDALMELSRKGKARGRRKGSASITKPKSLRQDQTSSDVDQVNPTIAEVDKVILVQPPIKCTTDLKKFAGLIGESNWES